MSIYGNINLSSPNRKSDLFFSLKDGETAKVYLAGDVLCFEKFEKPKARQNLVMAVNGALTVKIFEFGNHVLKQLKKLEDAGWDLGKTLISISGEGKSFVDGKGNTRDYIEYSLAIGPADAIPADKLPGYQSVKLLDLTPRAPKAKTAAWDAPPEDDIGY